jgi:hypothetical protein
MTSPLFLSILTSSLSFSSLDSLSFLFFFPHILSILLSVFHRNLQLRLLRQVLSSILLRLNSDCDQIGRTSCVGVCLENRRRQLPQLFAGITMSYGSRILKLNLNLPFFAFFFFYYST